MQSVINGFIASGSYLVVFLFMIILPIESVMPVAGFLAAQGRLSLLVVIAIGIVGSCVGSILLYEAARLFGEEWLYTLIEQYGFKLGMTSKDVMRAEKWFDKHAIAAVLFGRCIPGIRSCVSLPAGFRRMARHRFILSTAIGTTLWVTIITLAGYAAGNGYNLIANSSTWVANGILLACIACLVVFAIRARLRPH